MTEAFRRLAGAVERIVGSPIFFGLSVLSIVAWVLWMQFWAGWDSELGHLILNSPTTSLGFLLLALDAYLRGRSDRERKLQQEAQIKANPDVPNRFACLDDATDEQIAQWQAEVARKNGDHPEGKG